MTENAQSGTPQPGQGDADHSPEEPQAPRTRSGRVLRRTTAGLVAVVLVLSAVSYRLDLGQRWLGWDYPSPVDEPAEVAPPPGLTLPQPSAAPQVAPATDSAAADPAKVAAALAGLVSSPRLGRRVAVGVDQLSDGSSLYTHGADLVTPASTMKMLTTTAALAALGPDHRFRTTTVVGATPREVVLVGGGDPLLARVPAGADDYPQRADLRTLADATAKALRGLGRTSIHLRYDTSLFTGPAVNPAWPASYIPDGVVSPISPLWVDEGRVKPGLAARSKDPAAAAATVFAQALRRQGIVVLGRPAPAVAAPDADQLAEVRSAPLAQIVQHVLEVSDNEGAEVLSRQVAVARKQPASFEGGAAAVRDVLTGLGVDLTGETVLDGSGLSRRDRLEPGTLLDVIGLAAADAHPELRPVVADLPVAGFTGSLTFRFTTAAPEGLGIVRAKTGTLTGVHGLTGVVTTADGAVLSFVAIADRVRLADTLLARDKLDEIAAALAACACAAPPGGSPSASPSGSPPATSQAPASATP